MVTGAYKVLYSNSNDRIERRNSRFFTIYSLPLKLSPTRTLKRPLTNEGGEETGVPGENP